MKISGIDAVKERRVSNDWTWCTNLAEYEIVF